MKKLSLLIFLIIPSFIITSCKKKLVKRSPIILQSWLVNNKWRSHSLILGEDTQQVDSTYKYFTTHNFLIDDTTRLWYYTKKYYIPAGLMRIIDEYISNHCPCSFNCDSIDYVSNDGHFYQFIGYNKKGGTISCCMTHERDASIFYAELKKKIINSGYDKNQRELLLADLRALVAVKIFPPPPEVDEWAKKNMTSQEWESYNERKEKEDKKIKKEIKNIRDSMKKD